MYYCADVEGAAGSVFAGSDDADDEVEDSALCAAGWSVDGVSADGVSVSVSDGPSP